LRTFTSNVTNQKNLIRTDSAWIWLFDFEVDSSTTVYYTNNIEDVVFDSQTYTAKNIGLSPIKSDGGGNVQMAKLGIENPDQVMVGYLEAGGLLGNRIRARIVNTDLLTVAADRVLFRTTMISAVVTESYATLTIGFYALRKVMIPRGFYDRRYCRLKFKLHALLGRCKYNGGDSTCLKSLADCITKSNSINWGGFRSIPRVHR